MDIRRTKYLIFVQFGELNGKFVISSKLKDNDFDKRGFPSPFLL